MGIRVSPIISILFLISICASSCYTGRLKAICKGHVFLDTTTFPISNNIVPASDSVTQTDDFSGSFIYQILPGFAGITLKLDSRGRFLEKRWSDIAILRDNKIHGKWHRNGTSLEFRYHGLGKAHRFEIVKIGNLTFLIAELKRSRFNTLISRYKPIIDSLNSRWNQLENKDLFGKGELSFLKETCFIKTK